MINDPFCAAPKLSPVTSCRAFDDWRKTRTIPRDYIPAFGRDDLAARGYRSAVRRAEVVFRTPRGDGDRDRPRIRVYLARARHFEDEGTQAPG